MRLALGLTTIVLAYLGFASNTDGSLIINGATTQWRPILYGPGNFPDNPDDQQTGYKESELVGDQDHPSFYTQFFGGGTPSLTDGTIAFRVRLAENLSQATFDRTLFVGFDADLNGDIDLFVGVANSGSSDSIAIWNAGNDLNISPNTTSVQSPPLQTYAQTATNYHWAPVTLALDPTATDFDIDNGTGGGDHTDRFLSFSLPFADVVTRLQNVGISINENTPLRYVMATASQDNSLNQDLNGIVGGVNSTSTWSSLGGFSQVTSANGLVPEPSSVLLLLGGAGMLAQLRRLSRR